MADEILVQYRVEVDQLKAELKNVQAQMKATENSGKSAASNTSKEFQKAGTNIKQTLTSIAGAMGIAFGAQQLIQFGKESIVLAAKAEGIKKAFDKLNSPELLSNLRKATKGTVSDLELMKSAVKANNFQIPLEQLATLFKFAQQRAQETGESVDYLTESIVLGISRKSIPILDNLGISSQQVQKEFAKTGDFAVAVGNIVNKSLKEQGDLALTTADKMARVTAAWENLKVQVGEFSIEFVDSAMDIYEVNRLLFTQGADSANQQQYQNQLKYNQIELIKEYNAELDKVNKKDKEAVNTQIKKNEIALKQAAQALKNTLQLKKDGEEVDDKLLNAIQARYMAQKQVNSQFLADVASANKQASAENIQLTEEELKKIKEAKEAAEKEEKALRDLTTQNIKDQYLRERTILEDKFREETALYQNNSEFKKQLRIKLDSDIIALDTKFYNEQKLLEEKSITDSKEAVKLKGDEILRVGREMHKAQLNEEEDAAQQSLRIEREKQDAIKQLQQEAFNATQSLAMDAFQIQQNRISQELSILNEQKNAEISSLDEQLSKKIISQEQYDAKKKALDDKNLKREKELKIKAFDAQKQASIIYAIISTASGIATALTGDPYTVAARVALAAAIGAAQIAVIESQPTPKFEKGGKVKGKLHSQGGTLIEAEKDEWIIKRNESIKNNDLLSAINKGKGQKFIYEMYVAPALKEQLKKHNQSKDSSFASNIANSMLLNSGNFKDGNILESLKMQRKADKENIKYLAKVIQQNNYNARNW